MDLAIAHSDSEKFCNDLNGPTSDKMLPLVKLFRKKQSHGGVAMHALDRAKIYSCVGAHEKYPWKPMPWPGISNKVLFCDPVMGTTIELAKVDKGAVFPVHYHPTVQTLFLIKGRVRTEGRVITVGTFDVIPAGEKHGGYVAEEESIQYKLFSAMPVYFLENGDVFYYRYDGSVEKIDKAQLSAQNIMCAS